MVRRIDTRIVVQENFVIPVKFSPKTEINLWCVVGVEWRVSEDLSGGRNEMIMRWT